MCCVSVCEGAWAGVSSTTYLLQQDEKVSQWSSTLHLSQRKLLAKNPGMGVCMKCGPPAHPFILSSFHFLF